MTRHGLLRLNSTRELAARLLEVISIDVALLHLLQKQTLPLSMLAVPLALQRAVCS